jgi:hypothetical protein
MQKTEIAKIRTEPAKLFSQTDYGTYGEEILVPAQAVVPCPRDLSSVSPHKERTT